MEHIGKDNFEEKVLNSKKKVVVDFFADWCGPCKMLAPVLEELAIQKTDIDFFKVNVDEENELAIKYRVMSIPTIIIFENGEKLKESVGFVSKQELEEML